MSYAKRHIISPYLFVLLLFCLLFCKEIQAEGSRRVCDEAGIFSQEEQQQIEDTIQKLQTETGMDFAVVSTNDAGGKSTADYADDFYEQQNIGTGDSHDGMLYLIDLDHGEIYISTEGEMMRYLTDERLDEILDHAYEDALEKNYAQSALSVLQDTGAYIKEGIPEDQYHLSSETGQRDPYRKKGFPFLSMLFGMFAGAFAALGVFFSVRSQYRLTHETYHYPVSEKGHLALTESSDHLINQFVTHRKIPRNTSSSGSGRSAGSGRTTTHRSGSGRTHGGGGRKL